MSNINVIEDFLRYVKIDTQSDDTTGASPSTAFIASQIEE